MSYQKQNFRAGDTLYASQLDAMEDGIVNAERLAMEGAAGAENMEKGTGVGATQQLPDGVAEGFDFTDKNANATTYDATLTGIIPYGATGKFASAFGGKCAAQGKRSLAEGTTTIAKGDYSHSEGNATVALGANAHAEGAITTAFGSTSHAEGQKTQAKGENSHAEGMSTITEGRGSHSEGFETKAIGNYSHAEGYGSQALHDESHASGYYTKTGMPMQTVCGAYNIGRDNTFFEIGNGNATKSKNIFEVYTDGLIAVGNKVQQMPDGVADGFDFTDKNPNATALDPSLTGIIPYGAVGDFASAFGGKASAQGKRSHAEGTTTIAKGKYSHAEGDNSVTLGNDSHAEGYATVSKGTASHAQNYGTQAIGHSSHAGGLNTIAKGDYSTAIGHTTVAFGPSSFAGGYESQANGETSLAYGNKAITEKNYSVAIGNNIIAKHANVTVLGHFNDPLTEIDEYNPPLLIVGNGKSDTNRTNALIILQGGQTAIGGDTYIDGKLTIVGAPSELNHAVRYKDIIHNLRDGGVAATIVGEGAYAETYNSFAFGQGAVAGDSTVGMGHCIAMGNQTKAIGYSSAAIGYKTIASVTGQLATGSCNRRNDNTYFIVGNGTADAPSNAFEVYTNGDVGIYKDGKIYSLHKMLAAYFTDANLK